MTIGLISDTHSYLDPQVSSYFGSCEEIWHAGDIGSLQVLEDLQAMKPTFAVYGNIDDPVIRHQCQEDLWLEREGLLIFMTHIAGSPKRYESRVRSLIKSRQPRILICGHSHILKVQKDPQHHNMWYVNPGAAGRQGFHRMKTIMRMTLHRGQIANLEVIELGKRGAIGS
ncbi:MAG: metallophosphatase family protein [Cyclobacteriaceae bacterium]|nr:metallophosphatase family protein [Cyclobacteriaceae bacterium]